ncbi:Trm112 family protein [Rhodanobacter lindaniclasticus]
MDKRLLDILCCPVSKTPLRAVTRPQLDALNEAIAAGKVDTVAGVAVRERVVEALITTDRKVIYRIEDGIPVMLPEEGIGTLQLADFPASQG